MRNFGKQIQTMNEDVLKAVDIILLSILLSVMQPVAGKCVLGETLLNSLVGPGVQQKDEFVAEENVLGWSPGSLSDIPATNLTEAELRDCLQEYDKATTSIGGKPLPPGVMPGKDPSEQPYLPPAAGKDVLINENGGHGEYYTTYDASKYRFKEKGYVVDPPKIESTSVKPGPAAKPSGVTTTTTSRPGKGASQKKKGELQLWYKALVSVMSKYM